MTHSTLSSISVLVLEVSDPFSLFCFVDPGSCMCQSTGYYDSDDEYRLVRDLMKGYNKQVKPSVLNNQALNVSFGVALAQIIDLVNSFNRFLMVFFFNIPSDVRPAYTKIDNVKYHELAEVIKIEEFPIRVLSSKECHLSQDRFCNYYANKYRLHF